MPSIQTLPIRTNLDQIDRKFSTIIIIDVLRFCTSAMVALENGAREIFPCASRQEAFDKKSELKNKEVLLCGERGGYKIEGFDLGNSPREFNTSTVQDKSLIMATTNGTKALSSSRRVLSENGNIYLGCFRNANAISKLITKSNKDCLIVCSGTRGFFSLEDFVGAGMILDELLSNDNTESWQLDDGSSTALELFQLHCKNLIGVLKLSTHGRYLTECGFGADLPICAQGNQSDIVGLWEDDKLIALTESPK